MFMIIVSVFIEHSKGEGGLLPISSVGGVWMFSVMTQL